MEKEMGIKGEPSGRGEWAAHGGQLTWGLRREEGGGSPTDNVLPSRLPAALLTLTDVFK